MPDSPVPESADRGDAAVLRHRSDRKDRRRSSIFSFLKKNKKLVRQNSAPAESLRDALDAARLASHLEYFRKIAFAESALSVDVSANGYAEKELEGAGLTDSESEMSGGADGARGAGEQLRSGVLQLLNELYHEDAVDDVGPSGELVEEIAEENKSLIWFLVKQVRPGMDLSKVVLPTFILEPRSFLDKLSDNYYHADILSRACKQDDPYQRFKIVLSWYLSGLYKKPRGLKKPYNPVLGEMFRSYWYHPETDTRTYYIAEQVSHHPPISAFYVSNRKDGFVIEGSLLAKSKFFGNSTSAILDGCARVVLVNRSGETYVTSAPYAHCKGLVVGTLSMELGGKVHIICQSTGYHAEIEFKLKGFLGGSDQTNAISGRIKRNKDTVATLEGYWDGRIDIREKKSGEESVLVDCAVLRERRLRRHVVRPERLKEFESQRLWVGVSRAIAAEDQVAATEEKSLIEEMQRERARTANGVCTLKHFHKDSSLIQIEGVTDQGWRYNHSNLEPWSEEEIIEYEEEFVVHAVRAHGATARAAPSPLPPPCAALRQPPSDTDSQDDTAVRSKHYSRNLKRTLNTIESTLREQTSAVERLRSAVEAIGHERRPSPRHADAARSQSWDLCAGFVLALVLQAVLNWMFFRKD